MGAGTFVTVVEIGDPVNAGFSAITVAPPTTVIATLAVEGLTYARCPGRRALADDAVVGHLMTTATLAVPADAGPGCADPDAVGTGTTEAPPPDVEPPPPPPHELSANATEAATNGTPMPRTIGLSNKRTATGNDPY